MDIKVNETGNAIIIKLEGKMMLGYEAAAFHEAVRLSLDKNKRNVVVDLSEVKFISSWGIGILIHGYTTAANGGSSYSLAAVPEHITETFKKVKLDSVFRKYKSVEEALQQLNNR